MSYENIDWWARRSSIFFFSSRRRHTRCSRDWSSDVCSSDLAWARPAKRPAAPKRQPVPEPRDQARPVPGARSEERRVGKECIAREDPGPLKKNNALFNMSHENID